MPIQTGSLGALNGALAITTDAIANAGVGSVQVTGTFVGTITLEASTDGINWNAIAAYPIGGGQATQTISASGQFIFPIAGYNQARARMSSFTSGAATVSLDIAAGSLNLPMTPSGGGMVDTFQAGGAVSGPAGGAAVVANQTPGAGTWELTVTCGTGAGSPVAADVGNMQLMKNAAVLTKLANPVAGAAIQPTVRATLLATDTVGVQAVGAATAGVVYTAVLVGKRVG